MAYAAAVGQSVRPSVAAPRSARVRLASSAAHRGNLLGLTATRRAPIQTRKAVCTEARRASDPIIPPMVTGPRPEDSGDLMTHLLKNRIIFVGSRITDQVCNEVVAKLMALEAVNPKADIKMYINSQGGTGYAAVAILDAMRNCKCDISTVAFGMVASNATVILASGTKGKRYSMPNTRLLLAQPYGGAMGSADEVNIQASELNRTMKVMVRFMQEATGLDNDTIEEEIDRDTFLGPDKAVEMGLIDGIIGK